MNKKDLNEIKRRIRPDRSTISHIYGCYVNANREIISYIDESFGLITKEETEQYLNLLKKALSGSFGKNLIDISFATRQVVDSEEHRLLSALRKTGLQDEQLREQFYKCVIDAVELEESNYLILLAYDSYDVPFRGKDGAIQEDSSQVFNYILCSICPVKTGKASLGYDPDEKRFHNHSVGQFIGAPALGFMFPAFEERAANIYNALFYSHDTSNIHHEFIDAVFRTEAPMSAAAQMDAFNSALTEALDEDCSYRVLQSVHGQIADRLEIHKESKEPDSLKMSVEEVSELLHSSGLDDATVDKFRRRCEEEFGENAEIEAANLINEKKFQLVMPQVKISVDPKFSHLVQTRVIDGKKYVLISADSGVEVNGISINIDQEN